MKDREGEEERGNGERGREVKRERGQRKREK